MMEVWKYVDDLQMPDGWRYHIGTGIGTGIRSIIVSRYLETRAPDIT